MNILDDPFLVTYMTISSLDRRRKLYRDIGWIYLLHNPGHREPLLKIGLSTRPPHARVAELSAQTGVPEPFSLLYFVHVGDVRMAENHAHAQLAPYRKTNSKEFFTAPVSHAVRALDDAARAFPLLIENGGMLIQLPQPFQTLTAVCVHCGKQIAWKPLLEVRARCPQCRAPIDQAR